MYSLFMFYFVLMLSKLEVVMALNNLCLSISLYLCLSPLSLYLSQTKPYLKYECLLTHPPACPLFSLSTPLPPPLFSDKKIPAQFWLDKLFVIKDDRKLSLLIVMDVSQTCLLNQPQRNQRNVSLNFYLLTWGVQIYLQKIFSNFYSIP